MNESDTPPPVPETPFDGQEIGALLKAPAALVAKIAANSGLAAASVRMALWGLALHAVFGLAMALYGGWPAAFMTAAKAPLIGLCASALCLPSLYVFACVGGMPITIGQALAIAAAVFALAGLLLVGLAPVVWLFSVSTNSLGFVVTLDVFAWLIAMGFVLGFVGRFRESQDLNRTSGLSWWLVIYVLVSLQMATTFRPLLARPEDGSWWTSEKKFFLVHYFDSLGTTNSPKYQPGK